MRVPLFLRDQEVSFQTLWHAPAYTSPRRAKYLHVPGGRLAKCVFLAGPSGFVVAVLPATRQVALDAVAAVLGSPLRLARVEEIAQFFGDCEWGGLVPFGNLYGVTTIVDESLDPREAIVFAAQRHGLAISMAYADFERLERPRRFAFAAGPERPDAPQSDPLRL